MIKNFIAIIIVFLCSSFVRVDINTNEKVYPESRVGCFSKFSTLLKLYCNDQIIAYDILKTLKFSKRKNSKNKLNKLVLERATHFISNSTYDYYSVLVLMVFPIKDKKKIIKQFGEIAKEKKLKIAPFHKIALDRVQGKKSRYCKRRKSKSLPYALREICRLPIYNR